MEVAKMMSAGGGKYVKENGGAINPRHPRNQLKNKQSKKMVGGMICQRRMQQGMS